MQRIKELSRLPVPTWRWLGINSAEAEVPGPAAAYTKQPVLSVPEGFTVTREAKPVSGPVAEIDMSVAAYVEEGANSCLYVEIGEHVRVAEPLVIEYRLDEADPVVCDRIVIAAAAGSEAAVVIRYTGGGAAHSHVGFTAVQVEKDAKLHLSMVQLLGEEDGHVSALQADVQEGGELGLVLAELGGGNAIAAADVRLLGEEARADVDSLYAASGTAKRDLDYRIAYEAKRTAGEISARGALSGESRKVLKSTIDFMRGASGAKGREHEAVLVLSDKVVNISTPLLLCGEDDVEGQHATSIGRPDKDKLYYLESRGFTEKQAKQLIVEASLAPMIARVPHEESREEMAAAIREVVRDEG